MAKHSIEVDKFIKGSPEAVYAVLTDHPHLDSFDGFSDSQLVKEGDTTPHGKGAVRRVVVWMFGKLPVRFVEVITLANAPTEFHYLVSKANFMVGSLALWAGLKHYGGQVRLMPENGGCHVYWTSTMEIRVPLLGNMLGRIFKAEGDRIFLNLLNQVDKRFENS